MRAFGGDPRHLNPQNIPPKIPLAFLGEPPRRNPQKYTPKNTFGIFGGAPEKKPPKLAPKMQAFRGKSPGIRTIYITKKRYRVLLFLIAPKYSVFWDPIIFPTRLRVNNFQRGISKMKSRVTRPPQKNYLKVFEGYIKFNYPRTIRRDLILLIVNRYAVFGDVKVLRVEVLFD